MAAKAVEISQRWGCLWRDAFPELLDSSLVGSRHAAPCDEVTTASRSTDARRPFPVRRRGRRAQHREPSERERPNGGHREVQLHRMMQQRAKVEPLIERLRRLVKRIHDDGR